MESWLITTICIIVMLFLTAIILLIVYLWDRRDDRIYIERSRSEKRKTKRFCRKMGGKGDLQCETCKLPNDGIEFGILFSGCPYKWGYGIERSRESETDQKDDLFNRQLEQAEEQPNQANADPLMSCNPIKRS